MKNQRFWGIAAIVLGAYALADKVGDLPPRFAERIAMYWPLLLVLVGVLLLFKILKPIAVVIVVSALMLLIISPFHAYRFDLASDQHSTSRMSRTATDGVEALDVVFSLGAGSIRASGFANGLYEVVTSGVGYKAPAHTYTSTDGVGYLRVRQGQDLSLSGQALWDVRFSKDVPLRLRVEGGAGRLELDFRRVRLETLKLAAGAAKIKLIVGTALPAVNIELATAAADIDLTLPAGARIELAASSALLNLDLSEKESWERQGDTQIYSGTPGTPVIKIKIGSAATKVTVKFA